MRKLRFLGRIAIPTIVFFPLALALGSPVAAVRQLASGILTENQAPRSFWITVSLTSLVLGVALFATRRQHRTGESWTWEFLAGPRDLIRGWATTIAGLAAALGFLSLGIAVLDLSLGMLIVSIAALSLAATLAYLLDWVEPTIEAQLTSAYNASNPDHRRKRKFMIAMALVTSAIAIWGAFDVNSEAATQQPCRPPNPSLQATEEPD
jgi:hypothetical protein